VGDTDQGGSDRCFSFVQVHAHSAGSQLPFNLRSPPRPFSENFLKAHPQGLGDMPERHYGRIPCPKLNGGVSMRLIQILRLTGRIKVARLLFWSAFGWALLALGWWWA
jgi:hypothetical protein